MYSGGTQAPGSVWRRALALFCSVTIAATGCIVDTPAIDSTQVAEPTAVVLAPTAAPEFEPTANPAPPTAAPAATVTPLPTPTPEPSPTPIPEPEDSPTPLPTSAPDDNFVPSPIDAGPVTVPIGGTTFVLDAQRPVLQLGGHTLIYVDDAQLAEVDIFTPIADLNGRVIPSYADAIAYLTSEERFGTVEELAPVTIAGLPTRVFAGSSTVEAADADRAFITDVTALKDLVLGWYPPKRYQLWVIDRPAGTLIVSAESLEDPGQFDEALELANSILSTLVIR